MVDENEVADSVLRSRVTKVLKMPLEDLDDSERKQFRSAIRNSQAAWKRATELTCTAEGIAAGSGDRITYPDCVRRQTALRNEELRTNFLKSETP
jgi:uncharacterized protein YecT (DUF1311 family)